MKKYNLSKDYQFDIDVTNYTSYAGKLALPYVTAAVKSPDTIANGYVRVIDGLNKSGRITNIGITNPVQAHDCAFTDGSNTSLTENVVTLTDMKVNEQICRGTVFPTWIGENMDRNGNLPQTFADFLFATIAAKAGSHVENMIWKGSSDPALVGFLSDDGSHDDTGIEASILKDFKEVDFSGVITSGNVIGFLNDVLDKAIADTNILNAPGFGFYMNRKTFVLYQQALASATTFQALGAAANFDNLTFMGYPIYVCPGMFDNTIVATYPENLVIGTNLLTDYTEATVIPTYQFDGSDHIRVVMNFAMGCGVAVNDDGVYGTHLHA
tara:strand:+ start:13215 stop:14189 length:975 start_codon:yes stop_codon:yes gene_type:complete